MKILFLFLIFPLYPNNLKICEFGKEGPQNFYSERATIAERQGASENENYEATLTTPKTNSSGCLGIALHAATAGIGKADITPPIGTPSAGYADRKGGGMEGVHDPLLAIALFIDNGDKQIALCSVDHLGFTYDMTQSIIKKIHAHPELEHCEIFISSSHTHSGGGAYLDIPIIGPLLAGNYDAKITELYIDKTCEALLEAYRTQVPAKIGIGYGEAGPLAHYRGLYPKDVAPLNTVAVIKVTHLDDTPLAVLFNYPVHPTILKSQNRLFSADFVGFTRDALKSLGTAIYFNGAQGDIVPLILNENNRFDACEQFGKSLADSVKAIWDKILTNECLHIATRKESYSFTPKPTPLGLKLPIESYKTEMNLIVFNKLHAFITIPGELSCLYDKSIKKLSHELGFSHLSIFGLTNDAHGYIILPESWQHKTYESKLSFGGEGYGEIIEKQAEDLLRSSLPYH